MSIDTDTTTRLTASVQAFYAAQMQLLDAGRVEAWAGTFTEDGVFAAGGIPEPARGRSTIEAGARGVAEQFDRAGITRRHWLGMVDAQPQDDGTVRARSYALVYEIPEGGDPILRRSTTCDDVLVQDSGSWLVRHRTVVRDGLD
ncbi:nuclear transport factor 2 family protein [Pseudonocardia endophytica]|uniref:SnoaL-like protein n=1 Tax=Pseudonocardia endophytica TaxID=401976 RepID=A0A4R1HNL8_PSEEN|nr:nuclear transport factor 2 family protein [Pseudonocardia endophytica]TCK22195.1 SnoaL-like protein [Pseudonocardia endophytica]